MRTFNLFPSHRICAELGGRIKRLRLAQNMSQQQLADMTQSSLSSVRRLEANGMGSFELVVRAAQALQLVGQLEVLFVDAPQSIAQVEQLQTLASRKRSRVQRLKLTQSSPMKPVARQSA